MKLEDGTGNSFLARVDGQNHLHTRAVRIPENLYASLKAELFGCSIGAVNLTNAAESAVLYLKCEDQDNPLVITHLNYYFSPSTGGSATVPVFFRMLRNISGGTILTGGTDWTLANYNFSSSIAPQATLIKGAQGLTASGGSVVVQNAIGAGYGASDVSPGIVLPNGSSMTILVTPPTGNTSMDVYVCARFMSVKLSDVL